VIKSDILTWNIPVIFRPLGKSYLS